MALNDNSGDYLQPAASQTSQAEEAFRISEAPYRVGADERRLWQAPD